MAISRIKVWSSTEDVTASDLNEEFDNIIDGLTMANVDDYSSSVPQFQITEDPGEVGTESRPTSLQGEVTRLRKMIAEITGEDEWYESPVSSILGLSNALGTGLTDNRLVSGKVRTTSDQPVFLDPDGAARTVYVRGATTNFIYYVNGTEYTIASDVSLTGLTAAPAANNTCLINDAVAADQYWTKYFGEDNSEITVDTMGTEITALVGKFAAFKLDNGSTTEYFTAHVTSATSLTKAKRGYFFDSSDAPIPRIFYSNNDTITLMKMTWIFAKTDGTLTATYNNPVWQDDEPSSPALGDYWFDYSANKWKVYGVGSYSDANAVLIGMCLQDTTNTVAARSFNFFKAYSADNTVELIAESNSQVKSRDQGSLINVWGATIKNDHGLHTWDMTTDLESGVTEAASTYYYFYVTEDGDKLISDKKPHDRREDLLGYYHPSQSWRCVGSAFNNASSNLEQIDSYFTGYPKQTIRLGIAADVNRSLDAIVSLSGASHTRYLPPAALMRGQELTFSHEGTSLTQLYTLDGFGSETIGGSTTYVLYTNGETLKIISNGSNWIILSHRTETLLETWTTTFSAGWGVVASQTFRWRRSGKFLRGWGTFVHTSGLAASIASISLPGSLTIDATEWTKANTTSNPGHRAGVWNFGGTSNVGYLCTATGTSAAVLYFGAFFTGTAVVTPQNGNAYANGNTWHLDFEIPITEWKV
jgi:hypothetical protein